MPITFTIQDRKVQVLPLLCHKLLIEMCLEYLISSVFIPLGFCGFRLIGTKGMKMDGQSQSILSSAHYHIVDSFPNYGTLMPPLCLSYYFKTTFYPFPRKHIQEELLDLIVLIRGADVLCGLPVGADFCPPSYLCVFRRRPSDLDVACCHGDALHQAVHRSSVGQYLVSGYCCSFLF